MCGNDTNLGDNGCHLGVAVAADEQPFFGRLIRFTSFVNLSCCREVSNENTT
jgi:hypothetical protein